MNEITVPILITIAVIGIVAIILVKLFYEDEKASDTHDELPPIVANHWQESFDLNPPEDNNDKNDSNYITDNNTEDESNEEYGFVSKSWEEPMEQKEEPDNRVANKVFQEPMHSKHQDIIAKDYINLNDPNNAELDDLDNEDKLHGDFENNSTNENINHNRTEPVSEYITPKKYHSPNDENYDYDKKENNENDYELVNNYPDYHNKADHYDSQTTLGALNMDQQITIGGIHYTIREGAEIIFNYGGESYSSKILEIKHENIKVKYRGQEKWINFSDVKKVF